MRKPGAREAGDSWSDIVAMASLARSAGYPKLLTIFLGLTPQALC
jgi:hypothetical protein